MNDRLHRLIAMGIRHPVMQAGMPEVAAARLVAAVTQAGGIGTLGLLDVAVWESRLKETMSLAGGKPICANLLLPYTRKAHVDAVIRQEVPMVTLFWGEAKPLMTRLHQAGIFVFQQVGSLAEAKQALEAGVDGLILQGTEAGGHVRGTQKLDELLREVATLPTTAPLFAAGGIYTAADVRRVRALGASGVASGTRFLLTEESNAHPAYKQCLLEADSTIVTTLFGLGWPAPHRVVPNAATRKWCDAEGKVPAWLDRANASLALSRKVVPMRAEAAKMQRPGIPLFSPALLSRELPGSLLEATALYAGEQVGKIKSILSAEAVVQELAQGFVG